VTTAAGELEIQAPRVDDRREGRRFTSAILPPWARRSPKVTEVLPVLYLRGISTKDFEPALAEFFGSEAGLSASTIQRLTREWSQEWAAFQQRDLNHVDYVYLWADGVVRHEAPYHRAGGRNPPNGLSQQIAEAGGSLISEMRDQAGAASTTTRRVSTARWLGLGKQDGKG
jgi:hypothetical protein